MLINEIHWWQQQTITIYIAHAKLTATCIISTLPSPVYVCTLQDIWECAVTSGTETMAAYPLNPVNLSIHSFV